MQLYKTKQPNLDNPERDNDDETVAPETGTIPKKAPTKVHFEETKVTKQQPLPPTVGKGPGKVIPEKKKPVVESSSDSGSSSDSSDDEVTFLKKLVSANAFTEAAPPSTSNESVEAAIADADDIPASVAPAVVSQTVKKIVDYTSETEEMFLVSACALG